MHGQTGITEENHGKSRIIMVNFNPNNRPFPLFEEQELIIMKPGSPSSSIRFILSNKGSKKENDGGF